MDEERSKFWKAIEINGDRITKLEGELHDTVIEAVKSAMPTSLLSEEERRWVQLAIKKQAQSIAFRQSVIDKGLTAVIFSLLGGILLILKEYVTTHIWKQ